MGQSLHNSRLQRRFDVDVLELHRGSQSFGAPLADLELQAGDRMLLRCRKEDLLRLQQESTIALAPVAGQSMPLQQAGQTMRLVEVLLPLVQALPAAVCRSCASASATTPPWWRCARAAM